MPSTSLLIRVQARGGKFLGPDIGYSYVMVRDVGSGRVLAQGVAAGDSGQLGAIGTNDSSGAVMTQQLPAPEGVTLPPTVQWLSATSGSPSPTAGLVATFDLDAPALVEISAAGMSSGIPSQQTTSARMWIWPGAQLTTEPGLVLEMAGLHVVILEPNPSQPPQGSTIAIRAWVTMMCGCKIIDSGAWPTREFEVMAWLVSSDGVAGSPERLQIETVNGEETASVFVGQLAMPETSGEYQLIVAASQAATSNAGGSALLLSLSAT